MEILGTAAVLALAVIIIVLIFRDSIRKRIESGSPFESSFGPSGAKLLLGPSEKINPPNSQSLQTNLSRKPVLYADPRLVKFVPPLDVGRFKTIALPVRNPPKFFNASDAPTGTIMISQIPFFLQPVIDSNYRFIGHQVIDLAPTWENVAAVEEMSIQMQDVSNFHFLLSAGHGHATYEGVQFLQKRIGYIELLFDDNTSQTINLILGKNIREWAFENSPDLVRDVEYNLTQSAWMSHDNAHRIDKMSISVNENSKTLEMIRVVAKFEEENLPKPMQLPSIIISAITCERKI